MKSSRIKNDILQKEIKRIIGRLQIKPEKVIIDKKRYTRKHKHKQEYDS